jgi:hypothetical protein
VLGMHLLESDRSPARRPSGARRPKLANVRSSRSGCAGSRSRRGTGRTSGVPGHRVTGQQGAILRERGHTPARHHPPAAALLASHGIAGASHRVAAERRAWCCVGARSEVARQDEWSKTTVSHCASRAAIAAPPANPLRADRKHHERAVIKDRPSTGALHHAGASQLPPTHAASRVLLP